MDYEELVKKYVGGNCEIFLLIASAVMRSFSFVEMVKSTEEILGKVFSWVCTITSTDEVGVARIIIPKVTPWKSLCSVLLRPSDNLVMWSQISLSLYKPTHLFKESPSWCSRHQNRKSLYMSAWELLQPSCW